MSAITFDPVGFKIRGKDSYMVSGEFHYFRVPRGDWRNRMRLFREAGGNTLATYVPWIIHEPEEGHIVFNDIPNRDLAAFLKDAAEEGLSVILRPGPYQYSELINAGLPQWLVDKQEILARNISGDVFASDAVSYLHPLFLEYARKYFRAFAEIVRPFMAANGGPVEMLQVDNELMGIQVWRGSMDYNKTTMGIGVPGGRYPRYLENKYKTVSALNSAYGTAYSAFDTVVPTEGDRNDKRICRCMRDYQEFYGETIAEYACLLVSWLNEDGLYSPICHNSANPNMNAMFTPVVEKMGSDFLLGSDHYYNLSQDWPQNNPTPQYAVNVFYSCEMLRLLGMPPSVLELPGGSASDVPPILPEDLLACYLTNLAYGMKGLNYYIFTGGPNFESTGNTCDLYDYGAPVRADGSLGPGYAAVKEFGEFMSSHSYLQRGRRVASARIGFEWKYARGIESEYKEQKLSPSKAWDFTRKGLIYGMFSSKYSPELIELSSVPSDDMPLIVPLASAMSPEAQTNIAEFIRRGGKALFFGAFPEIDHDCDPCTILYEALGSPKISEPPACDRVFVVDGKRVFQLNACLSLAELPAGTEIIAESAGKGEIFGISGKLGKGSFIWCGFTFLMQLYSHAEMLELLLEKLGAVPAVESDNRGVLTSLWEAGDKRVLFALNLASGRQRASLKIHNDQTAVNADLGPMEVRYFDL